MLDYLTCKKPVYIRNRYTGEPLMVPCGHCAACRIKKAFKSKVLLDLELKDFKYKVFFTLTYNDTFLPRFEVFDNLDLFDDKVLEQSKSFLEYNSYSVPYFSTNDFQLFIKNLRYEFSKYSSESLYYWFATEFGPTKFRPHGHGILFFNSEQFSEVVEGLIPACWSDKSNNASRGFVDVQFVASNATSYVSQYVNCALYLPKILETSFFKPRKFSSRTSAEGSFALTKKDVIQIIFSEYKELTFWSYSGNESGKPVTLWRLFKDRWFPKCRGFARLSDSDRRFMYKISSLFGETETFDDFYQSLVLSFSKDSPLVASRACSIIRENFFVKVRNLDNVIQFDVNALRNAYYLSRRFRRNYEYLNTNFESYYEIVVRFWSNQELFNIKQFWADFDAFSRVNSSYSYAEYLRASLLLYDPLFFSRERELSDFSFHQILSQFGYDSVNYHNQLFDAQSLLDNLRASQHFRFSEILRKSHKNRSKNEFITNQILGYE